MAIPDSVRTQFDILVRACQLGALALMECKDTQTGQVRYVICAVNQDHDGVIITPFGHMAEGNPYDAYTAPLP